MDNNFIFVEYDSTVMDEGVTKPLQKSYLYFSCFRILLFSLFLFEFVSFCRTYTQQKSGKSVNIGFTA